MSAIDIRPLGGEDAISQIPALQLLRNLGYTYLTPEEVLALRGGRASEILLLGVLEEQLPKINRIRFKVQEFPFTGGNIAAAQGDVENVSKGESVGLGSGYL